MGLKYDDQVKEAEETRQLIRRLAELTDCRRDLYDHPTLVLRHVLDYVRKMKREMAASKSANEDGEQQPMHPLQDSALSSRPKSESQP